MAIKKYDIRVNTTSPSVVKKILLSVVFIIIGMIIIFVTLNNSPLIIIGIAISIISAIYLLRTCFKNLQFRTITLNSPNEFPNDKETSVKWEIEEEIIDLGDTKIDYQSKFYNTKNNKVSTDNHNINDLNTIKKIVICPNCGSKNVIKINNSQVNNSRCQHCNSYIE